MTLEPQAVQSDVRLVLTRLLDAPRDLVWEVWTSPQHIAQWWGPEGFTVQEPQIDLRVGGAFSILLTAPDGSSHPARGTFVEIADGEKFVIEGAEGAQDGCGAGLPPGARLTVRFTDVHGKTKLTIDTEFPSPDAQSAALTDGYRQGWETSFDRIAARLTLF